MLRCPWHCWEFDIRTGQSWCDPDSVQARTYAVADRAGRRAGQGSVRGRDSAGHRRTGLCRDDGLIVARTLASAGNCAGHERDGTGAMIAVPPAAAAPLAAAHAVRLEDVARQAGVSTASVSRALNTPDLVSPELRDRIARAAQELKWVPNGVAKALASLRTRTVGVMIPTLSHQNFAMLIEALQQDLGAAQLHADPRAASTYPTELRLQQARKLVEQGVECLVLVGEAQPAGTVRSAAVAERSLCHHLHQRPRQARTPASGSTTTPRRSGSDRAPAWTWVIATSAWLRTKARATIGSSSASTAFATHWRAPASPSARSISSG